VYFILVLKFNRIYKLHFNRYYRLYIRHWFVESIL